MDIDSREMLDLIRLRGETPVLWAATDECQLWRFADGTEVIVTNAGITAEDDEGFAETRATVVVVRLPDVTIRLNAVDDLAAASLDTGTADQFARAYRAAAAAICDGIAEVAVVAADYDAGCDAAWAQEFGLWQAAHDCVDLDGDEWYADEDRVTEARRNLSVWMTRNVPAAAEACDD